MTEPLVILSLPKSTIHLPITIGTPFTVCNPYGVLIS